MCPILILCVPFSLYVSHHFSPFLTLCVPSNFCICAFFYFFNKISFFISNANDIPKFFPAQFASKKISHQLQKDRQPIYNEKLQICRFFAIFSTTKSRFRYSNSLKTKGNFFVSHGSFFKGPNSKIHMVASKWYIVCPDRFSHL